MNKITKSFLTLLLLGAGVVSAQAQDVPEKDQWFTDNVFCYKDAANDVSRSMELPWVADPDKPENGCIALSSAAGAGNDHDLQFMIRGAEYDGENFMNGAFAEGKGFKVSFKVKGADNYEGCLVGAFNSIEATGKNGWKFSYYLENQAVKMDVTTTWQTVSYCVVASSSDAGQLTAIGFNLAEKGGAARTFYFDDVEITPLPADEAWFNADAYRAMDFIAGKPDAATPVRWVIDPANPENSCFAVTTNDDPANDYDSQLWIRATAPGVYMAEGQSAKLVMRVKADRAQSGIATQYHKDFAYFNCYGGFGTLDVGTEWETVVFTGTALQQLWQGGPNSVGFTDFCFNLSDKNGTKTANTFYIDDVRIVVGEEGVADWYVRAEPQASDYEGFTEEYTTDPPTQLTVQDWSSGWPPKNVPAYYDEEKQDPKYEKTKPVRGAARWVAADNGGYIEVKSNPKPINNYDSQLLIQAWPEPLQVNQRVTVTMKVQADAATTGVETQVHKGAGDWTNNAAGDRIDFTVGEPTEDSQWTEIKRVFAIKNEDLTKAGNSIWYVLNLSNGMEANVYRFKDIQFSIAPGEDDWYQNNTITYVDGEIVPVYGDNFCIKAAAAAGESKKLQFTIPASYAGKKVKMTMKVKASVAGEAAGALIDGETSTAADGVSFTDAFAPVELILDTKDGGIYELTLGGEAAVDYFFDDLAFDLAPVTYEEPELETTEQWYQDVINSGVQLISRSEPAYSDGDNGDKNVRYLRGEAPDGDYLEYVGLGNATDGWRSQMLINMTPDGNTLLEPGTKIEISMRIKASEKCSIGTQKQNGPGGYIANNPIATFEFDTQWSDYTSSYSIGEDDKTTCFSLDLANTNGGSRTFYFDDVVIKVTPPINPADYTWTDLLNGEGSYEGAEKSDYIIGKIMKGHLETRTFINDDDEEETEEEYIFDEVDPEFIRLKSSVASTLTAFAPVEEFDFGENVLDITPARQKTNEAGEYAGNAWDSQLFIRLPYVLPQGTRIGLVLDVWTTQDANITVQEHMEADGNGWLGDFNMLSSIKTEKRVWQHVAKYGEVDKDMRSIVFNLANVPSGCVYRFDNIQVVVCDDDMATVQAYQETLEEPATSWENFLALNEAIYDAKQVPTEGMGYTEESVTALETAIADAKGLLKVEEGEQPYTDENLVDAKADVEAAVAGLEFAPFAITIDENIENGTVEADVESAKAGETVTLTATPADDFEFEAFSVVDADGNAVEVAEDGTFVMPESAVTVSATFTAVDIIEGVSGDAIVKDGKYFINGEIVIVKDGKFYDAAGFEK